MYMPDFKTLDKQKEQFKSAPVCKEIYADIITPITLLSKIASVSEQFYLLESVEGGKQWGRYSFLGFDPVMTVHLKNYKLTVCEKDKKTMEVKEPYKFLREVLKEYHSPSLDEMPPFTGGFVGNFSYNMIQYAEPVLKLRESEMNDFDLMLFDKVIAYDHLKQKICIIVNYKLDEGNVGYEKACEKIEHIIDMIRNAKPVETTSRYQAPEFTCNVSYEEYERLIERTKEYIVDGDIFQGVISRRFEAEFRESLLDVYRVLRTTNPSPYMFYMKMKHQEYAGTSPETLVKMRDRKLVTFPVAGTRKRGTTTEEDQQLERELLADEKELAEHNMLVDLARNDIGRVSQLSTVKVEEYMQIHRYSKVMHIASIVSGNIKEENDAFDALSAVLPAGTLSGAPKIRACEIINELEPTARGIYGGAIGYIDFTGNMDTCIAIRMAVKHKEKLYVQAGGGIVADSDVKSEYEETANKASAVINAVKRAGEVQNL